MVKVKVEQGWLEGEVLDLVTGNGQYYSFKGIPYAAPPLGKLRFKAPQPPLSWKGVKPAKEHGPVCTQFNILTQEFIKGSEDCLYLNVFSPNIDSTKPLPVMVFIHGGAYKSGSGNIDIYGPDFLVDHKVVLVTINYRLDALGFLCLDTEEVPGNAGMKDQVAALKWVKTNIANFGGDPANVTVFGESAGGASAMYHVVSPSSKGLFKRAIAMSGVPSCDWSIAYQPVKRAFILGKILGKETNDTEELLAFLQTVPAEDLVNRNVSVLCSEEIIGNNIIKMFHFTPVIEKDFGKGVNFIIEDPAEYLKKGNLNDVDILMGYTNEETLLMVNGLEQLLETYNRYPEMVVPREILIKCTPDICLSVADKISGYYLQNKAIGLDIIREFITYLNHASFVFDILRVANKLPKVGNSKRFLYRFSCVSERNYYGNQGAKYGLSGAAHFDDIFYLFNPKAFNLNVDKNSKGYEMVQLTCRLFTNFAKYGNPTPDSTLGVTWPEYNNATKYYGNISDSVTIANNPEGDALEFWKKIYDYAGVTF